MKAKITDYSMVRAIEWCTERVACIGRAIAIYSCSDSTVKDLFQ